MIRFVFVSEMTHCTRISKLLFILLTLTQLPRLSALPVTSKSGTLELIILHNNDMHARFDQTGILSDQCNPDDVATGNCYGGFPRVAHV